MPEATYNPKKTGGFAYLSVDGKPELRQIGDGPILSQSDKNYRTNSIKYSRHATQKVLQLFTHPEVSYSKDTPLEIPGGITFKFQGKLVIFSYSG